jgi:hypothetical protein
MVVFQSAELQRATLGWPAGSAVCFATSPACAFSQENIRGGADHLAFTDPDNQAKNFGSGAHPFGPNGPVLHFGTQRCMLRPLGVFSVNNNDPPEPVRLDLWAMATEFCH